MRIMMRQRTTTTISKPPLLSLVYSTLFIFLIGFACWDDPPLLTFSFAFNTALSSSIATTLTHNNLLFKKQDNNNAISSCQALSPSSSSPLMSKSISRTTLFSWTLLARKKDDGDNKQEEKEQVPDIQSLRDDIRKWSRVRSPHAPNEATHALRVMFRHYKPKNRDTNIRHSKQKGRHGGETVDVIDCTQVINAWSKSHHSDAPKQVIAILKGMIASYKVNNNSCIRPNVFTYTAVINTFARRRHFDGAEKVFMMQLNDYKNEHNIPAKPNLITFNAMIDACSKCDRDDKPEIAMKLLKTIINWYERGDLEYGPDIFTYGAVINCWSKSNRPEGPNRALDILETMITKSKDDGNTNIRPNTITYSTVMDAFAKQGDVNGANKVFTMMKENYSSGNNNSKPNIVTYAKQGDIDCANKVFTMMKADFESGNINSKPNKFTYTILMEAWNNYSGNQNAPFDIEKVRELINNDNNGDNGLHVH